MYVSYPMKNYYLSLSYMKKYRSNNSLCIQKLGKLKKKDCSHTNYHPNIMFLQLPLYSNSVFIKSHFHHLPQGGKLSQKEIQRRQCAPNCHFPNQPDGRENDLARLDRLVFLPSSRGQSDKDRSA